MMSTNRSPELHVAQTVIPLPCFFPSVSSLKTQLTPVDYVELLAAAGYPLFLVSAYDLVHCTESQRRQMRAALRRCKEQGSVILMDSGNYERLRKADKAWQPECFHQIAETNDYHVCFCYDNQNPPSNSTLIAEEVVAGVLRDLEHALGTVLPIVHGSPALLPDAARRVAEQLYPILLAVPERELGKGIVERTRTVRRIRKALNTLEIYCPLHLLGTGNPLSMIAYALAGADSFDGLEWCRKTVDHKTGTLLSFQQWDSIREQTQWGQSGLLPYIQSVLMHNLEFYHEFMARLREAIHSGDVASFVRHYASDEQAALLINAAKAGDS